MVTWVTRLLALKELLSSTVLICAKRYMRNCLAPHTAGAWKEKDDGVQYVYDPINIAMHCHAFHVHAFRAEMAEGTFQELDYLTVKLGYSKYRTHVSVMNEVASHQNFNKLQPPDCVCLQSLNPNSGIPPGKSGFWNSSRMKKL